MAEQMDLRLSTRYSSLGKTGQERLRWKQPGTRPRVGSTMYVTSVNTG